MGLNLKDRTARFFGVSMVLVGIAGIGLAFNGCSRSNQPNDADLSRSAPTAAVNEKADVAGGLDELLRRATVQIERRRFDEAIGLLRPLLVTEADNPQVLFLFAQCEAGLGDLAAAVTTLERISPDHPEAGFAALGQAADWLITLKQYDDAEAKLRLLVETHPKVPFAHRRLAQLLNNQGRRWEAAPHMQSLLRLGDVTESELFGMHAFSEPFIHTLPPTMGATDIPSLGLSESRLMLMEGKIREAREHAEGLRANDSKSTSIAAFLGRVYAELHDDEALAQWARSLPEGIESEPEFWFAAGVWHQNQSLHPTAVRCFAEAVRRDQTDRASFLALARSLAIAEKPELAERVMRRYELLEQANLIVIEQQRTRPQLDRLVQILDTLRRPEEARAWETLASRMPEVESSLYIRPQYTEIDSARIASVSGEPKEAWLLCGIEPDDWPLPKFADLADQLSSNQPESTSPTANLSLVDVAKAVGLDFRHRPSKDGDAERLLFHETVGGGIAVIDYDLDGWADLYFAQAGGDVKVVGSSGGNELFRNLEGRRFQQLAAFAGADDRGFGQGVSVVDFNQDGFADLAVANIGVNVLLVNNGDGTFASQPLAPSMEGAAKWTTSIASGDLDGDQLPDLVEVNYIDDERVFDAVCHGDTGAPLCNPQRYRPASDRVLQNDGRGGWQLLTLGEADKIASYGFAALIVNFDGQHGNDLFVANDTDANHYWVSSPQDEDRGEDSGEGGGHFALREQASLKGCALGPLGTAQSCMGVAHGDFDRNGLIDLHITNFTNESSDLYVQQASGLFQNQAVRYGLDLATGPMMGWGTQAVDFDNDGWLDLAILNGNLYNQSVDQTPYRMAPQLLRGAANRFELVDAESAGDPFWQRATLGRALTSLDWNRDGRVDLVANHLDTDASLLENRSESPGRWVQLELVGTASEREAIGARVRVKTADGDWTAWMVGGDAFLSSRERSIHIGLGNTQSIEAIEIKWPAGETQSFLGAGLDRRYLAIEGEAALFDRADG